MNGSYTVLSWSIVPVSASRGSLWAAFKSDLRMLSCIPILAGVLMAATGYMAPIPALEVCAILDC